MRIFHDVVSNETLTELELIEEYIENKDDIEASSGAKTFTEWLNNCLSKDGTLIELY